MSCSFNISKGKVQYYWEDARNTANAALICVLLKSTGLVADATMADYDDLAALLAGASDECDFTNYTRKTVAGTGGTGPAVPTIDDTNNRALLDLPDQTWATAGGTVNNTIGALVICYDNNTTSGTDANLIPLVKHDMAETTNGNDLVVRFHTDGSLRVV